LGVKLFFYENRAIMALSPGAIHHQAGAFHKGLDVFEPFFITGNPYTGGHADG
jgi:hypothetical protein